MDPVTLAIAAALGAGGALWGKSEAAKQAEATARARNDVLRASLARTDANAVENRGLFDLRLGDYAPGVQPAALETSQTTRANNNAAALTGPDAKAVTFSGS